MKILVIEDDSVIRKELLCLLNNYGYEASAIETFNTVLEDINKLDPNLILLDVNLPLNDGYTICRKVREVSSVPIIIITSRDTEMDELLSMNLGADDFIRKPFNTSILLARVERLLSRAYNQKRSDIIQEGELELDILKGSISYKGKDEILTKNEMNILHYFITHKNVIISREELMMSLWSSDCFIDDNTLSVNITRLRKKLESLGIVDAIKTRRGLGYIMI